MLHIFLHGLRQRSKRAPLLGGVRRSRVKNYSSRTQGPAKQIKDRPFHLISRAFHNNPTSGKEKADYINRKRNDFGGIKKKKNPSPSLLTWLGSCFKNVEAVGEKSSELSIPDLRLLLGRRNFTSRGLQLSLGRVNAS